MKTGKLGVQGTGGMLQHAGIARIVIPDDVERQTYIEQCYRTCRVQIGTEWGEFYKDVAISREALNNLVFPVDKKSFGSQVVWVSIFPHRKPVIVGVLVDTDNSPPLTENTFSFLKETAQALVNVLGNGNTGILTLEAVSRSESMNGIVIRVGNQSLNGIFRLRVDGNLEFEVKRKIKIKTYRGFEVVVSDLNAEGNVPTTLQYEYRSGLTYNDEFGNVLTATKDAVTLKRTSGETLLLEKEKLTVGYPDGQQIQITPTGVLVGKSDGSEPTLLGQQTVELLKNLLAAIQSMTFTIPGAGVSGPPNNSASFTSLGSQLQNLLSGQVRNS